MSHHHYNETTQMRDTISRDNIVSRRYSHTHLNLKPTAVFDHIKTKVKRKSKQSSNNGLTEIPAFATSNNLNCSKRSSQEHNELESKKPLKTSSSQPIIATQRLSDHSLDHNNEQNNVIIEKDENNPIVPDHIDDNINASVQWRLSPIEPDNDNTNEKITKSKLKLNKASKSISDASNQSIIKKRRQKIRRTVQSSSKIQPNKKNKRSDLEDMEDVVPLGPYGRRSFQIRDEDFNNIFKDLPSDEKLIVAYPCAWQKDIFMHGRIFLSFNYLCFYACFFKWEESLCIAYKDITSVRREKSAKIIANAIELQTKNREQYIFASYIPRERIYSAIFRLWQNASLEKPLDYQQLRTIVCADQMSIDESTGDSEESIIPENNEEYPPHHSSGSQSLSQIAPNPSKESLTKPIQSDEGIVPPLSPSHKSRLNQEQTTYALSCSCEIHLARTYADRLFSYDVDQLFELTYGDNSFTRACHDSQKLTDYTIGEWRTNNETGKRERLVTYKTVTQSVFGTYTLTCNEKQVIEVEKPGLMYVVSTEVANEGMKYTDSFIVATRFCMFQRDAKHSSLRVTAEVRYVKTVNGIAKSFIEKNCHSSIEDGINNFIRRLEDHQKRISNHKSGQKQSSSSRQRHKKHDGTNPDEQKDVSTLNNFVSSDNQTMIKKKTITGQGFFFDILLFIGILLLILHIYLCYKLYSIDQSLFNPDRVCLDQCRKACLSNK